MGILLVMMVIFLFLGAFMDWVGIVLLVMPVFLPIVVKLPIEEIGLWGTLEPRFVGVWFGILFCVNMQVSFLSPAVRPRGVLPEVRRAAAHHAARHLQRFPAVHRAAAVRARACIVFPAG